jgi:hypothetical protein
MFILRLEGMFEVTMMDSVLEFFANSRNLLREDSSGQRLGFWIHRSYGDS